MCIPQINLCIEIAIIKLIECLFKLPVAHAFPCSGGSGKEYCSGYHKGALQADKDWANPHSGKEIFSSKCPSGHTTEYCNGWTRRYDKESQFYD